MRITLLLLLSAASLCHAALGPYSSVTLAWDRALTHGTNISYVLKWSTETNVYPNSINLGTNTTTVFTNLTSGLLYFVVTAKTTEGIESDPSNMVAFTNYPAQPIRLRITTNTLQSVKLEGTRNGGLEWQHLATVTNDPVTILGGMKSMLLRASANKPPLP
jgi:hypothetical protein